MIFFKNTLILLNIYILQSLHLRNSTSLTARYYSHTRNEEKLKCKNFSNDKFSSGISVTKIFQMKKKVNYGNQVNTVVDIT